MDISWLEQSVADVPAENHWLSTRERNCLSGMRFAKRRTDWLLGRWTAKQTVAAGLNLSNTIRALADIEILSAPSGAPEVFLQGRPAEIALSLSHRDGIALCMVALAGTNFGCDLEKIEPRSDAFVADYFTSDERAFILRTPVERQPLVVALVWSAKESALKALRLGLRLDTRCMSVRPVYVSAQPARKEWQAPCADPLLSNPDSWHPLSVRYFDRPVFGGWWRKQDDFVRTAVSDVPLRIPARARQESGLSDDRGVPEIEVATLR